MMLSQKNRVKWCLSKIGKNRVRLLSIFGKSAYFCNYSTLHLGTTHFEIQPNLTLKMILQSNIIFVREPWFLSFVFNCNSFRKSRTCYNRSVLIMPMNIATKWAKSTKCVTLGGLWSEITEIRVSLHCWHSPLIKFIISGNYNSWSLWSLKYNNIIVKIWLFSISNFIIYFSTLFNLHIFL